MAQVVGTIASAEEFLMKKWHRRPMDRQDILMFEHLLETLLTRKTTLGEALPPMTSYRRMLLHEMADLWGFEHRNTLNDGERTVTVTVVPSSRRPRQLFREIDQHRKFGGANAQSHAPTYFARNRLNCDEEDRSGARPITNTDTGQCAASVRQGRTSARDSRSADVNQMADLLGLSEKTTDALVENHFCSLADLELLAIEELDKLRLPLRDASAIKRHLQSMKTHEMPNTLLAPPPAYTEIQAFTKHGLSKSNDSSTRLNAPPTKEDRKSTVLPTGTFKVLLLGETGAGKSTLINYLTNFFLDGSIDNLKIAINTKHYHATERYKSTEQNLKDSTVSKTSDCSLYDFKLGQSIFHCIDTPGLSDTGGAGKDDRNTDKIMASALNAGNLSAIIIVINGSVARATANLKNTLARMRGSMPDVVEKNLIVVLTNCTRAAYNFDLPSLKPWTILEKNVFFMNNLALSRNPSEWQNNEKLRIQVSNQWEESMNEIQQLVERITQLGGTSTEAFKTMRERRDDIRAEISGIFLEIKKLQIVQDKLESAEKARVDAADNIEKYANFKQTKEITSAKMVDAPYHNTMCQRHQEKLLCHERCGLDETTTVGDQIFKGCYAFRGGQDCGMCGCGFVTHFHAKKKIEKVTEMVEDILQDEKAQFELHTGREAALAKDIGTFQRDMQVLQTALKQKLGKIENCCQQLQGICKGFNFVAEMQANIAMMEADARTLTSLKAREASNEMVRNIRELIDQFSADTSGSGKDKSLGSRIRSLF